MKGSLFGFIIVVEEGWCFSGSFREFLFQYFLIDGADMKKEAFLYPILGKMFTVFQSF